jgi:LysM repeat protein
VYLCDDIAEDAGISVDDLTSWNPWVGSDCDTGLYTGLNDTDIRAVCIENNGTSATGTTTASPSATSATATGPTQTGIVSGCTTYYTAVSGDGCSAIATDAGITLDEFYAWNPAGKFYCFTHVLINQSIAKLLCSWL